MEKGPLSIYLGVFCIWCCSQVLIDQSIPAGWCGQYHTSHLYLPMHLLIPILAGSTWETTHSFPKSPLQGGLDHMTTGTGSQCTATVPRQFSKNPHFKMDLITRLQGQPVSAQPQFTGQPGTMGSSWNSQGASMNQTSKDAVQIFFMYVLDMGCLILLWRESMTSAWSWGCPPCATFTQTASRQRWWLLLSISFSCKLCWDACGQRQQGKRFVRLYYFMVLCSVCGWASGWSLGVGCWGKVKRATNGVFLLHSLILL